MVKTSNTFVEKHTVIEKLNPMTKVLAIFSLGLGTLIFPNSWLGLLVIIGLFIVAYIAKILKEFTKVMLGFGIPITVMLMFIQGFYSPKNKTMIADFGFASLGLEGVLYALKIVSTLLVFLGSFYIMNKTTYTGKLVAALTETGLPPKVGYLILASLNVVPQMQRRMVCHSGSAECQRCRNGWRSHIKSESIHSFAWAGGDVFFNRCTGKRDDFGNTWIWN